MIDNTRWASAYIPRSASMNYRPGVGKSAGERGATVHTDSLPSCISLQSDYAHNVIDHAEEYVDGHVVIYGVR